MLFTDNTLFLDKCAETLRRHWGMSDCDSVLPESVVNSMSECCDMGWYISDGEYIRWEQGLTLRNIMEKCPESAILWQAILGLLGSDGGKTVHRYSASYEIDLPVGNGEPRRETREVKMYGNLFADTVYPLISSMGRRGRKVSVSELVTRLSRELGDAFGKKRERLMEEIPLAEDAAYVLIRFSGYQPDTEGVENKAVTASGITVSRGGTDNSEYLMLLYGEVMNYIATIPHSERWIEDTFAVGSGEVSISDYNKNLAKLSADTESALEGLRGVRGLNAVCADAARRCQNGISDIKRDAVNKVTTDITCKINAALDRFSGALTASNREEGLKAQEEALDELYLICVAARNLMRAHLSDPCLKRRGETVAFGAMLKRAQAELADCREIYSVIRAELELRQGDELQDIKRGRLLGEIHEIEEYVNTFEELRIENAESKESVFAAMNDLKRRLDALDALYVGSASAEYGGDFRSEEGIYGICDAIKKKADGILDRINKIMDDPAVPDFSDSGVIDDSEWIYDLGDGAKARFVLVDEAFNELVYEESSADKGFNFYDFDAYHRLTDNAIAVKRQPVFGDYPEFSGYAYFRPFQYQLDSVRTMLSRFEGRGVFGDQVGLGKTLQTMMAADVMFRCGSIANAVIVAREANIYQWRTEIERKFRNADGMQTFKLLPERGYGRIYYTIDELPAVTAKADFNKREGKLKIYFLSSESLQSEEFAERIEDIAAKKAELARITEHVDALPEGYPLDEDSIRSASNIDTLFFIKKAIYNKLLSAVSAEQELLRWEYRGIRYGFDDFDPKLDREVKENGDVRGKGFFPKLNEYNELIGLAASRMESMLMRRRQLRKSINEFDLGSIGLLIFDEVQEIIDKLGSGAKEKRSAEALREFVADIEKKYCILLSATPVRKDLSDVFQLLYMVDKNRLGETRAEAENNFYRIYCGGCRTLADIANAPDREHKFKMLNGLINSIFTRKRIYDTDVTESMRRQSATAQEREVAAAHGRDDYGGERFETLMKALSVAFEYARAKDGESESELRSELASYSSAVYGGFGITDDAFVTAALDMSEYVVRATYEEELTDGVSETAETPDICKTFIENKRHLLRAESVGDEEAAAYHKRICDRMINRINRGLTEFYRADKDYSAVFIADCLDWTRPYKRGISISGMENEEKKIKLFVGALGAQGDVDCDVAPELTERLKRGKVVFYDSSRELGKAVYRTLGADNSGSRRIYLNLTDADMENGGFSAEDAVRLNYFGNGGMALETSKNALDAIRSKDAGALSADEKRYLKTYGDGRPELSHSDINFINFTEFSDENSNRNAVCFIDRAQTVGTDLNAAGVLCIGQLDDGNGEYMDPLAIEQLIGRVSRLGQTEECLIFTCLYNGDGDGSQLDEEFNAAYYELLTDPEGFDLFGVGMTEVSFALPVVNACLKQMLSSPVCLARGDDGAFSEMPERDFAIELAPGTVRFDVSKDGFAEMVRYVYANRDGIRVIEKNNGAATEYDAIEGVKRLIRKYVSLISIRGDGEGVR